MPLAEVMVLDQFLGGVPEDRRVWLKERSLSSSSRPLNWLMMMLWPEEWEVQACSSECSAILTRKGQAY